MAVTRREFLQAAAATPLAAGAAQAAADSGTAAALAGPAILPDRESFHTGPIAYLDSGSQHPLSVGARAAVQRYLAKRALDPAASAYSLPEDEVRAKFARLINASPDEIAYVPSTTAAEQMFVRGLGFPARGARIVTDTLHFFGSIPLYEELAKQGVRVTWVRDRDGRIPLEDLRKAITADTRLVSLSLVSTINGFEHDLQAVCDHAHAQGALVYADIIHAAGAIPLDIKASGVDFAACATYKWLMGEFGLGFAYVRKESREQLKRTEYGYYGLRTFVPHIYPFDTPSTRIADYAYGATAEGQLAHGTHAHTVIAQLDHSLDYVLGLGVPAIQAHAQKLVRQLKAELPKLGYRVMTPTESTAPMVACAYQDAREKLHQRLADADVRITLSQHRFRATPSVFNDEKDIERLLAALGRA